MKKKKSIIFLSLLILLIMLYTSGCINDSHTTTEKTKTLIKTETVTNTETATVTTTTTKSETKTETKSETLVQTTTITVTETITVTYTPTPTLTLPSNPAKVGEPVLIKLDNKTIEVTIMDYIRGEIANSMIRDASTYNEEPPQGYEYILVKVKIRYLSGNKKLSISPLRFRVMIDGALYGYESIMMPYETPELDQVYLLPGGKVEGWLAFTAPKDKKVLIAYTDIWGDPLAYIEIPEE
ncbi:hypothetical protein OCC_09561 [Thermococcus litoralis DSM 5473]|uniref:DUF4352 domain-containing protein n=1 Tax=Thermococcus litoralis (strain ATCC 51850 / DSM 5473 / JCM 8560 / NS-C) TaxID=523849 RepID=H3ZQT7_THELN|nr:DUF4352 domain-containing protein [Thermococcus litoralis]EHR77663.1 hypothetical protein OCC_09561 [Thermococcus litoralis DSM 5473]